MKMLISVQLYTLRDEMSKDFVGVLEKVAEMGYQGVEFAGYGNLTAPQMKDLLKKLGLKATGAHVGMDLLKDSLDAQIEYNAEIGNPYIICPWAKFENKAQYLEAAALFNKVGEKCKAKGITLCYHNHAHEFELVDGIYGLDFLFQQTDPEFLQAEIDTYWVQYAGIDPVEYIKKYKNRLPILHQKDMEAGEGKAFAEIGNGIMDIKSIYNAGLELGTKTFVVEQDVCKRPALESVKISLDNLRKMGIA
jgi:sugar phosphate isomerase/epimerase